MTRSIFLVFSIALCVTIRAQNTDPLKTKIVTSDLDHFWNAFELSKPAIDPAILQSHYLDNGSKGIVGFMNGRIKSAEELSATIRKHYNYYNTIKSSTDSISEMADQIRTSLVRLKDLHPDAIFPPVYFVIGRLTSGGTSSKDGLIIGAEMYGKSASAVMDELSVGKRSAIKPVNKIPHIVAHELIHFQQKKSKDKSLLAGAIKEGSADFIAELISGRHINDHIHDFANPMESELWLEFRERMLFNDFSGWLYSSTEGRPNDLGYWIGYKITKSYYDKYSDKRKAVNDILKIDDYEKFLKLSEYPEKFK